MAIGGAQELLQFLITANGQQAIAEINAVGAAAARQEALLAKQNKRSAAAYTALGAKQLGVGLVAGAGLIAAASAAADLDKSMSRVNATFGEGAGYVQEWARNANEVFLSDRQAAAYAANIGEAAQGLGLAADESARLVPEVLDVTAQLAVLKGLDMDNSIESIAAALRGEFDATQKLIPALSARRIQEEALAQTGKQREKDLTTAEKAYATLNIILEDGQKIIEGNSEALDSLDARWQKTRSNVDDAVTSFGAGALPAVEGLAGAAQLLAGAMNTIPAPLLKVGAGLATLGAAGSIAVGGLNLVKGGLQKLKVPLVRAVSSVSLLAQAFPKLAGFGTAAAVAAVAGSIYLISKEAEKAEFKIRDAEAALRSFKEAAEVGDAAESWEQLARLAENAESTFDGLADFTFGEGAVLEVEGVRIEIENLRNVIRDLAKAKDLEGLQAIAELFDSLDLSEIPDEGGFFENIFGDPAVLDDVEAVMRMLDIEMGLIEESAGDAAGGIDEVGGAAGEAEGELDGAAEAAERLNDAFSSFDAVSSVVQGLIEQGEATAKIAEAETALREAREGGKADEIAAAERDLASAYIDQQSAAVDLLQSVQNVAQLGPQAITDLKAGLLQAAEGGLIPRELVAQTIAKIDEIVALAEAQGGIELPVEPEETDYVAPWLQGKQQEWAGVPFKLPIDADTAPAEASRDSFLGETGTLKGEVEIDSDPAPGRSKRDQFIDETRGKTGTVDIDADPSRGRSKRDQFIAEKRTTTVNVDANVAEANRKIAALSRTISVNVQVSGAGGGGGGTWGPGLPAVPDGIAGPGDVTIEVEGYGRRSAGSLPGGEGNVGTYINNQTINLPRGADGREVEQAQRRYAARNGSPRR